MKKINLFLITIISLHSYSVNGQNVDCHKEKHGFTYESKNGCSFFNMCIFFNEKEQECPYGLHFDPSEKLCKNPNDISSGKCSFNGMCTGVDGEKFPHSDCDKFYLCYHGKPILTECTPLHYDYKTKTCIQPDKIVGPCHKPANMCSGKDDGTRFPHSDKTKFYFCVNGDVILMDCGDGLIYDENRNFCVAKGTAKNFQFPCNRKLYE